MTETKVLEAKASQSRNDLHWSVYAGSDGTIRWAGYDDSNWWDNVSTSDHARTRVGKVTGDRYVIDFNTCAVEVTKGELA